VLGLIDPAHGPYVHQQWWWRTTASQHEKNKRFAPSEAGFTMVRHEPSKNSKAYAILGGEPLTEITFRLPGLRWEHVTVGKKQVLALSAMTPINAGKTRMNQIMWSDHWAFTAFYPIIRIAARAFLRQDGRIVGIQSQGPGEQPAADVGGRRRPAGPLVPAVQARMDRQPPRGPAVRQSGQGLGAAVADLISVQIIPGEARGAGSASPCRSRLSTLGVPAGMTA
jgi:phenylpropionate dioxygenase-like ring-hydroxylating dioxygenase large terminal subunit